MLSIARTRGGGYEYAKNSYIMIEDDELEAVQIESSKTIDIDTFVPRAQIDERYFNSSYYIVSEGKVGQEAFVVIRDAMKDKKMAALARVVLSKREHVIMLQPWDKGIMGTAHRCHFSCTSGRAELPPMPLARRLFLRRVSRRVLGQSHQAVRRIAAGHF
jgi:Ku protein